MNRQQRRAQARAGERAAGAAPASPAATASIGPWLEEAAAAHQSGNFAKAEAGYRRVLKIDPRHGDALNLLGVLALQTGDYEEAARRLEPVVKRYPKIAGFRANLANALRELGRGEEAEKHYREALKLDPNLASAHADYAFLLHKKGALEKAAAHYRKAIGLDPKVKSANANLAALLQKQGSYEEALTYCDKALAVDPNYATALTIKGVTLVELERVEESLKPLENAVKLNPQDVGSRTALATAFAKLGKFCEAQEHQKAVLDVDPNNAKMHSDRGWAAFQLGLQDTAFEHLMRALQLKPDMTTARIRLLHVLQIWHPTIYLPELDGILFESLNEPEIKRQMLARPLARQILRKVSQSTAGKAIEVQHALGILSDPLAKPLLTHTINSAPEFERVLVILRRCLLLEGVADRSDQDALTAFSLIAQQAHNNSYVWWLDDDERRAIDVLSEKISDKLKIDKAPDDELEFDLLRYAMYAPIDRLPCFEKLLEVDQTQWSKIFQPFAQQQLHEPWEERQISKGIQTLGSIENDVSRAVQTQYEENPYPRWFSIERHDRIPLDQCLKQDVSGFDFPAWTKKPFDLLIAGCGTGQQVVARATTTECKRITAVDLSRASLAYAARMSKKIGVTNVEYLQSDILELGNLDRDFHVIECGGVLHHMDDPEAGWSVLTSLLRPGGLMLIGLYSEIARRNIVAAREKISQLGLNPDADDIRVFRKGLIDGKDRHLSPLLNSKDFYDLNCCRDLLFHIQEHRYTIPDLKRMLSDQGLEFLGFIFDNTLPKMVYDGMFHGDPNRINLENWTRFEERFPSTFGCMYRFWCHKPE